MIGGELTGAIIEGATSPVSGALTITDPDPNEAAFTAQTDVPSTYGTFTLTTAGEWSYTLDNTATATTAA